jgi:hypothetical protein
MVNALAFLGLFLTLVGACLLFFYGLPQKRIGNVIVQGTTAMQYVPDPGEPSVPPTEWQPIADKFLKRAKVLNSAGFGLVAVGTLMEMLAIVVSVVA